MRRSQQEFTVCTSWRRQALTTKSEKGRGQKQCGLNNKSQLAHLSSLCFFPPWSSHWSLRPSLCQKSPPQSLSCPYFSPSSSLGFCQQRSSCLTWGVVMIRDCGIDLRVCCQTVFSLPTKNRNQQKFSRALRTNNSSLSELYHAILRDLHSLVGQLQSHLSKVENGLTRVYI